MKRRFWLSAALCMIFTLAVPSFGAVTVRIDPGEAMEDANIADVMMDVLTTRGYDIVLGGNTSADALISLRTVQELETGQDEQPVNEEADFTPFSDGSAEADAGPVLSMSEGMAENDTIYQFSRKLAESILGEYAKATGEEMLPLMDSAELGGSIPSVVVKVDAMKNNSSMFTEQMDAGQAWIAYIIASGIDQYFIDNPGAVTGRTPIADPSASSPERIPSGSGILQQTAAASAGAGSSQNGNSGDNAGSGGEGILSRPSGQGAQEADTGMEEARTLITNATGTAFSNLPSIGSWALYVNDLKHNVSAYAPPTAATQRMQAASLIKLFIMGAVYEQYDELSAAYGADTLEGYLYPMITVSDNDAANALVGILGGGDSGAGMGVVNAYCQNHGYDCTSMGRLLLASNEFGDNYTSVVDVGRFLSDIYRTVYGNAASSGSGDIWTNYQASADVPHASDMLNLLSQQERRHKIPAGLPDGVKTANKTGELGDVENDAAIIYDTDNGNDLVIVFMSENLTEVGTAQNAISNAARTIYDFYH